MIGHWEILLLVLAIVLLFGSGKISALMGDVAKGIKSFKKGLSEDDDAIDSQSKGALKDASGDGDKVESKNSNT